MRYGEIIMTRNYGIKKSDGFLLWEFLKTDVMEYPKFRENEEKLNEYGENHLLFLFDKVKKEAIKANKKRAVSHIEIFSLGNLKNIQRRLVLPAENFDFAKVNILIKLCTCGSETCWGETVFGKL